VIPVQEGEKPNVVCIPAPTDLSPQRSISQESVDADAAHGQMAIGKLWPKGQDVLHVYITNPNDLRTVGLNEENIKSWANMWETVDNHNIVPVFRLTKKTEKANIRVRIGEYCNHIMHAHDPLHLYILSLQIYRHRMGSCRLMAYNVNLFA